MASTRVIGRRKTEKRKGLGKKTDVGRKVEEKGKGTGKEGE